MSADIIEDENLDSNTNSINIIEVGLNANIVENSKKDLNTNLLDDGNSDIDVGINGENNSDINNETIENENTNVDINGTSYLININNNDDNQTMTSVTDESGNTSEAVFNSDTGMLTIDGIEIQLDEEENDFLSLDLARSANKVLKRKTYTIPGNVTSSVTALIAGLAAISNFSFGATVISSFVSGGLWGKSLKTTITEYRSGSKCKSGRYKGKYQYWTNVIVKVGSTTILNQNHSVGYK